MGLPYDCATSGGWPALIRRLRPGGAVPVAPRRQARGMTDRVMGIDPGPTVSGWAVYDGTDPVVCGVDGNDDVVAMVKIAQARGPVTLVIERVQNYGRNVGKSLFDTLYWSGRFAQAGYDSGHVVQRLYFMDVRQHFVGKKLARERDVWLKLVERYGGAERAVGTRKAPGTIAHVKGHARSAFALALTWWDRTHGLTQAMLDGVTNRPV